MTTSPARVHVVYLAIIAALALALVLVAARLSYLNAQLAHACAPDSVVARLDLSEWVPVCRSVQIAMGIIG